MFCGICTRAFAMVVELENDDFGGAMKYITKIGKDGLGPSVLPIGPGMSQYTNLYLTTEEWREMPVDKTRAEREAETLCEMLQRAFDAGKEERSKELRKLLGVHGNGLY